MIDFANLAERFDFAAAHYQSLDDRSDLDDLVELFEKLRRPFTTYPRR
jgi:hypothetical protein